MGSRGRLALFATVVVALSSVPVALATPPTRSPIPNPGTFTLSGVCSFDLVFNVVVDNEKTTAFSDGRTVTTGAWKDVVYNASDPSNSYVDNNSGVIFSTPNSDGTVTFTVVGQGGVFFFPGDLGPGSPGMALLFNGRLTETIDFTVPQIVPGSVTYNGAQPIDLCQVLA
jgi:hypothetical protein